MIVRAAVLILVSFGVGAAQSSSRQLTPDDGAVIDVALTAASLTRLREMSRASSIPPLLVRSQTAAVCAGESKPGVPCVDFYARVLREQLARKPNVWPVAFYDAILQGNGASRDLTGLTLAAATWAAPDAVGSAKAGKALAQVSLPTYVGDRAIVLVWTSYFWNITHAVLIEKRSGRWAAVSVEVLGRS